MPHEQRSASGLASGASRCGSSAASSRPSSLSYRWQKTVLEERQPIPFVAPCLPRRRSRYVPVRSWVLQQPGLDGGGRPRNARCRAHRLSHRPSCFWRNHVVARLAGTYFRAGDQRFPTREVDVFREIRRRPPGQTFVVYPPADVPRLALAAGLPLRAPAHDAPARPRQDRLRENRERFWPQVLQDALDGRAASSSRGRGATRRSPSSRRSPRSPGRARPPASLRSGVEPARAPEPHLTTWSGSIAHAGGTGGDSGRGRGARLLGPALGDNRLLHTQAQIHVYQPVPPPGTGW